MAKTEAAAGPNTGRFYLAAPLFSQQERQWNRALAQAIETGLPGSLVVLPQDFRVGGRYNDQRHYGPLFRKLLAAIAGCDALIAVLDGPDVDSGTAFEIGYAYALKKSVIGLRTDYRPGADHGVNLMVAGACRQLVREYAFQEDSQVAAAGLIRRLKRVRTGR